LAELRQSTSFRLKNDRETMKGRKRHKGVFLVLAGLALVAAAGWLSNAGSKAACRQQVGSWLFTDWLAGQPFYLLDADGDRDVWATFDSIGATYSVLPAHSDDPKTWPRLSLKTHAWIPFVISVDYFWEREVLIGGGGTKWFLCLFGRVVEIGDTNQYAT
jgi:hypothetical protein